MLGNAYVLGVDLIAGDVGTGGAPSLPVEKPYVDYGPPLSAYKPKKKTGTQVMETLKNIFTAPAPVTAAAPKAPVPFWSQPVWAGAPLNRKQAALAGGGIVALGTGLTLALVRR